MKHYKEQLFKLIEKNKGFVTSSEVTEARIPRRLLSKYCEEGKIYKVDRGIYALPDVLEDEMFFMQYHFSKGIYSHETALYLHGLTDRTPSSYTMTFPFGYNTNQVKKRHIITKTSKVETYPIGICEVYSSHNNKIMVYDVERTLCDMVKSSHKGEIHEINQAMKTYALSRNKDLGKLMDYAQKLRVKSKVLSYMTFFL